MFKIFNGFIQIGDRQIRLPFTMKPKKEFRCISCTSVIKEYPCKYCYFDGKVPIDINKQNGS